MTSRFFVTGTDTDVGKTVVSAWLALHLKATYWKPIQSGACSGTDRNFVQKLTGLSDDFFPPEAYLLQDYSSPHQAAAMENTKIDLENVCLLPHQGPMIVEGAGGVMVPLNAQQTMLDLIGQLGLPVIVVARTTLGTINHTCLTLQVLRHYGLSIAGVILNGPAHPQNQKAIEHFGQVKILGHLPQIPHLTRQALAKIPLTFI